MASPPVRVDPTPAELLRAIIDSSPFATMAFDRDQQVVLWNPGAERLFGWTAAEVVGGPIPEAMIPARDRTSSKARIERTLAGAAIQGELVRRRTKDGRDVAIEIHAGPLRDADGGTIGFAGHMVDVEVRPRGSAAQRIGVAFPAGRS